ncbi:AbrB/MazE/SpoVT family DNA-binding domain-containing protein [Magnetovirga frankeli]|uniref:AbrB/MazE/SpoVT family DNA-binding domain-containing protein n=1 Tax=Magnetovirga frankeli TaxID=947516 RepID=UPI00129311C4|nr:AbrB/MazE/SpoVT family DNA-binding domain-containing protein [gamma proteobacterium SS-5]
MTQLVRIGNSQGIRIPKPLIEQAHLEGKEIKLQLVNGGLLITPENGVREGWKEAIERTISAHGQESLDDEWLDFTLDSDDELEW